MAFWWFIKKWYIFPKSRMMIPYISPYLFPYIYIFFFHDFPIFSNMFLIYFPYISHIFSHDFPMISPWSPHGLAAADRDARPAPPLRGSPRRRPSPVAWWRTSPPRRVSCRRRKTRRWAPDGWKIYESMGNLWKIYGKMDNTEDYLPSEWWIVWFLWDFQPHVYQSGDVDWFIRWL